MRLVDGAVSDILSLLAHAGAAPRKASSRAGGRSAKPYLGDVRWCGSPGCRFRHLSLSACARTALLDVSRAQPALVKSRRRGRGHAGVGLGGLAEAAVAQDQAGAL